jgi:hypothetical protein
MQPGGSPFEIKPSLRLRSMKHEDFETPHNRSPFEKTDPKQQIDKARCDAIIGNNGNPSLIDGRNGTILQKIGIQRVAMIALGCLDPSLVGTTE